MSVRKLSRTEIGDLALDLPQQDETGLTMRQRFVVKNLIDDAPSVQKYLRAQGYEVRRFGGGTWDFAVRRANGDPWKSIDPKPTTGGLKEWFYDLMDLTSDIGVGAMSAFGGTLGAMAGPAGAIAGAGAGAAAGEALRQGLGAAGGVDERVDAAQIAIQGAMGMAVPGVGRAVKGVAGLIEPNVPKTAALFRKVGAKIAGIRSSAGMLGEEALDLRANWKGPMPTFEEAAAHLRKTVLQLGNKTTHPFPERQMIERMVNDPAAPAIDGRAIFDKIRAYTLDPRSVEKTVERRVITEAEFNATRSGATATKGTTTRKGTVTDLLADEPTPQPYHTRTKGKVTADQTSTSSGTSQRDVTTRKTTDEIEYAPKSYDAALAGKKDPLLHDGAQKAIDDVTALLNHANMNEGNISAAKAMELKELFQGWAREHSLYDGTNIRPVTRGSRLSYLYGEIADDLSSALTSSFGGPQSAFANLMTTVNSKTRAIGVLREAIGKDLKATESYVASLHGRAKGAAFREIEDLEKVFGLNLKPVTTQIKLAEAGSRFGPGGNPEILPLYTATGQFRTLALGGGGFAVGGPVGAVAATLGASPKAVVALTKQANRLAPGFQRAMGHLRAFPIPPEAHAAASATLAGVARLASGKGSQRQDSSARPAPPVKGVRIGS